MRRAEPVAHGCVVYETPGLMNISSKLEGA